MLRQGEIIPSGVSTTTASSNNNPSEVDPLLPPSQSEEPPSYAATSNTESYYPGESFEGEGGDEDDVYSLDSSEDEGAMPDEASCIETVWMKIKGCFMLVVDVENLWDSPTQFDTPTISRRNKYIVLFWFFLLALSYATERCTFKLVVDRTGPFRLVAVQIVTFSHATLLGLGMFISCVSRKDFSMQPLGIPIVDVGLMALLDTIHMLLVFLTGIHVAPTLTAILVQFTLPLTALITQFVHPDGCTKRCCGGRQLREQSSCVDNNGGVSSEYRQESIALKGWGGLAMEHILGSIIILLAVLLALCPAIYSILDPDFFIYADTIPIQTAYNTLLFVSSCIPAAASQLYKEHVFLQHKQPVQPDHLNLILSIFQFIFASIMAPLVYILQGLAASDDWPTLYPSSGFSQNFKEGLQCFVGLLDEDQAENGYDDEAICQFSLSLVLLHAFAIITIGVAVDKIVSAGATKVMYRGVSAGIIFSVISLYVYDINIPDFSYGPAIDSLNLVCLLLLVVGSEVYHRVSLQDATFETVYPEVENFYDDHM